MKKVGDIFKGLPEIQPELALGLIETTEDPHGHYQLKFPGDTVAKSNEFIRYRVFMSAGKDPIAYRLLAHFIAGLHSKKDDEMGYCLVKVRDFMPNSSGADYARAREAMIALASLMVERYNEEQQHIDLVFSGSFCYNRTNGTVRARLNPELKAYFLKLYQDYATYGLLEFNNLRSFYSQRLFEVACSIRPKSEEIFPLAKLQRMLNITQGSMLNYADFKRRALEPAKKEINKYTNMKFDYEAIKESRAVAYIKIKAKRMNKEVDILA